MDGLKDCTWMIICRKLASFPTHLHLALSVLYQNKGNGLHHVIQLQHVSLQAVPHHQAFSYTSRLHLGTDYIFKQNTKQLSIP